MIKKQPLLILGVATTLLGLVTTGAGFAICLVNHHAHIKIKMLTFMILPNLIAAGASLIILHLIIQGWKKRKAGEPIVKPDKVIAYIKELGKFKIAGILAVLAFGGGASLLFGSTAYHFTESTEFCGQMCHEPMGAQYAAFQDSPHASIRCVDCHVGPTLIHFAKAKLAGMHQVKQVMLNTIPRPIYAPLAKIPPADLTCKRCHWEDSHWGEYTQKQMRYGYDAENSTRSLRVQVKVGGISHSGGGVPGGVHHHMQTSEVHFLAVDERREEIASVTMKKASGEVVTYEIFEKGEPKYSEDKLAEFDKLEMDCLACHNRPAHRFESPDVAIDTAIARGVISRTLPFAKKLGMQVLRGYPTKEEGLKGIEEEVTQFYKTHFGALETNRRKEIDKLIVAFQELYNRNVYPEMKLTWNQYPSHIGHRTSKGCMRCHNKNFINKETGQSLNHDCRSCHLFFKKSRTDNSLIEVADSNDFVHPFTHGKKMKSHIQCWDCHSGRSPYTSCTECHEKEVKTPVMGFECSVCHKPGEGKVTNKNCQACHPMGESEGHLSPESSDCLKCHKKHMWKVGVDRTFCPNCRMKTDSTGQGCKHCESFKGVKSLMNGLPMSEPVRIPMSSQHGIGKDKVIVTEPETETKTDTDVH